MAQIVTESYFTTTEPCPQIASRITNFVFFKTWLVTVDQNWTALFDDENGQDAWQSTVLAVSLSECEREKILQTEKKWPKMQNAEHASLIKSPLFPSPMSVSLRK